MITQSALLLPLPLFPLIRALRIRARLAFSCACSVCLRTIECALPIGDRERQALHRQIRIVPALPLHQLLKGAAVDQANTHLGRRRLCRISLASNGWWQVKGIGVE